jgi:hypothetical protein
MRNTYLQKIFMLLHLHTWRLQDQGGCLQVQSGKAVGAVDLSNALWKPLLLCCAMAM